MSDFGARHFSQIKICQHLLSETESDTIRPATDAVLQMEATTCVSKIKN